jgi:hypothetical protein
MINTAFGLVDSHNHTAGQGVPITPAAININSDLSFNGLYNATNLRSVRLFQNPSTLSTTPDVACAYSVNGDLYWNSSDGTAVQITSGHDVQGGTVGNIQGLTSPAAVNFSFGSGGAGSGNGTYTFLQGSSWYSAMISGAVTIFDSTAASPPYGITLLCIPNLSNPYTLTLFTALPSPGKTYPVSVASSGALSCAAIPGTSLSAGTLPASTLPMLMDTSGNLSTGQITAAMLSAIPTPIAITGGTLGSGWTASNGLAYWKDAVGMVHVKGVATSPASNQPNPINLPAGYVPGAQRAFAINISGTGDYVTVTITPSGGSAVFTVTPDYGQSTAYVFDGIAYLAEA